jgi:hypothetical protein
VGALEHLRVNQVARTCAHSVNSCGRKVLSGFCKKSSFAMRRCKGKEAALALPQAHQTSDRMRRVEGGTRQHAPPPNEPRSSSNAGAAGVFFSPFAAGPLTLASTSSQQQRRKERPLDRSIRRKVTLLARVRVRVCAIVSDHLILGSMILTQMEPQMMLLVMKMQAAPSTSSFSTRNQGASHPARRPLEFPRAGTP